MIAVVGGGLVGWEGSGVLLGISPQESDESHVGGLNLLCNFSCLHN